MNVNAGRWGEGGACPVAGRSAVRRAAQGIGYVLEDNAFYLRFRFRGRSALPGARARSSQRISARSSLRRTARRSVKLASRFRRLWTLNHQDRPRMNVNAGRWAEGGACPVAGRSGGRGLRRGLDMLLKIQRFIFDSAFEERRPFRPRGPGRAGGSELAAHCGEPQGGR